MWRRASASANDNTNTDVNGIRTKNNMPPPSPEDGGIVKHVAITLDAGSQS